jgi:hypothetical protein
MDPIELAVARWVALEVLQAHLNRQRETTEDSLSAYARSGLVLNWLARRGFPMERGTLDGSVLTYLKDAGYVRYRTEQPAGPRGETVLYWRITKDGMQILEGARTDPGIRVA